MVTTRANRTLLGEMNLMEDEIIIVNEEEISSSLVTTSSSPTKDTAKLANANRVKFKKHIRKSWTFKNV